MFCELKRQTLPILFGVLVSKIFLSTAAASTFTLVDTIPVIDQSIPESLAPRDLVVTPDGSHLYIYNIVASGSTANIRVLVVDINLKQLVNIISLGAGATSNGITVTPDGFVYLPVSRRLSSLAIGDSRVEVIDTATDTPVASIIDFTGAGGFGPDGPAVTPDGSRIYFTYRGSQRIYEIDTNSNTVLDVIATSTAQLMAIDITPDGTRGYAVNRQDRKIYVFDTDPLSPSFNTEITVVPTSLSSSVSRAAIKITPDGTRAYVSIAYTNPSNVSVIDTDPTSPNFHTEIAVIPTTGSTLGEIAITSDGQTALIASADTNEVIVIDIDPTSPTFHTQIGSVPLPARASYITYDSVSNRAFVSLSGDNSIGVIAPVTALSSSGSDQTVNEGDLVTLDGSGSTGTGALNYTWTQLAGPSVTLDLTDPVHPTFSAPFIGSNATLTFELIVDDSIGFSDPDTVDITVVNTNNPPVSDAGDDTTIKEGATTTLDGSNSFDPEGDDPLSYNWGQVAGPFVSLLPSETVVQPNFTAPLDIGSVLIFKLTVSDGLESSTPSTGVDSSFDDTVAVTIVENSPPEANAGPDQTKDEGTSVTLDGTGSSDPDGGDIISYQWTQTGGISITLDDATAAMPSFTGPAVSPGGEILTFELVVSDDDPVNPKSSVPDEVIINVRSINGPPTCDLAFPNDDSLWPPNHKMKDITIEGVMDEDSAYNTITLQITAVAQDEPVNGLGDGDTSPDAVIQPNSPNDSVLIRAERSGNGNGRVYEISFVADDGFESCNGAVNVSVPHSRKDTAVDDGQLYDSTQP